MAVRKIREIGDEILNKTCREVKEITPRIEELIEDMYETMYESCGVGLAAPQIGILKRIVVIDVGMGDEEEAYTMINPKILEVRGSQTGTEGCLSVPGKAGTVTRPDYVRAQAYDEEMNLYEIEGEGLLARAICHELDHLDGKLYVDLVEGELSDTVPDDYEEE